MISMHLSLLLLFDKRKKKYGLRVFIKFPCAFDGNFRTIKSKREKMEVSTSAQKETSAAQEKSVKPTDINRTSAWLKNFLKTKRVEQDILVPEIEVSLLLGC